MPFSAPLVYINGNAGIGKHSIAVHLASVLPVSTSHPPLLIASLRGKHDAETMDPRSHPEFRAQRKCMRPPALLDSMGDAVERRSVVIVADAQATDACGRAVIEGYAEAARRSGRMFVPITLMCGLEEHVRRLARTERKGWGARGVDVGMVVEMRERVPISGLRVDTECVIEVDGLGDEEVALRIARWVWWVGEFMSWGEEEE